MRVLMGWWLVVSAAALSPSAMAEPSRAEVSDWSAPQYLSLMSSQFVELARALEVSINGAIMDSGAEGFAHYRLEVDALLAETERRVIATPLFDGDGGLRDGAIALLATMRSELAVMLGSFEAHLSKPVFLSSDLDALDAALAAYEARAMVADDAFEEAQRAFARRHGVRLEMQTLALKVDADTFAFPSIVPPGAHTSAALRAGAATRYHNVLTEQFAGVGRAVLAFFAAPSGPSRAATLAELAALRQAADATGAWQGDDALRAATLKLIDGMSSEVTGSGGVLVEVLGKARPVSADQQRFTAASRAIEGAFATEQEAWLQTQRQVQERWGILALQQWLIDRHLLPAPAGVEGSTGPSSP